MDAHVALYLLDIYTGNSLLTGLRHLANKKNKKWILGRLKL